MKLVVTLITTAIIAGGGYAFREKLLPAGKLSSADHRKTSAIPASQPALAERMANLQSGKWRRCFAKMVSPTPDGQVMTAPDGATIHVSGELGINTGEMFAGYFEQAGSYECPAPGGTMQRVPNYVVRATAVEDYAPDLRKYATLSKQMRDKMERGKPYEETFRQMEIIDHKLRAEGVTVRMLDAARP